MEANPLKPGIRQGAARISAASSEQDRVPQLGKASCTLWCHKVLWNQISFRRRRKKLHRDVRHLNSSHLHLVLYFPALAATTADVSPCDRLLIQDTTRFKV